MITARNRLTLTTYEYNLVSNNCIHRYKVLSVTNNGDFFAPRETYDSMQIKVSINYTRRSSQGFRPG